MNSTTAIAGPVRQHRCLAPEEPAVVSAAIGKAHEQAARWHREGRPARERLVRALSRVLVRGTETLAALMANEIGKPVRFGRREVMRSAEMLDAIATRFRARLTQKQRDVHRSEDGRMGPLP